MTLSGVLGNKATARVKELARRMRRGGCQRPRCERKRKDFRGYITNKVSGCKVGGRFSGMLQFDSAFRYNNRLVSSLYVAIFPIR